MPIIDVAELERMIEAAAERGARRALESTGLRISSPADVVTVGAAAERFTVTAAWLRREIRMGRLPALHAGRQRRVRMADVEALMQRPARAEVPFDPKRRADELLARRRSPKGRPK